MDAVRDATEFLGPLQTAGRRALIAEADFADGALPLLQGTHSAVDALRVRALAVASIRHQNKPNRRARLQPLDGLVADHEPQQNAQSLRTRRHMALL